jgi:hypothetical protein
MKLPTIALLCFLYAAPAAQPFGFQTNSKPHKVKKHKAKKHRTR